MNNNVTKEQNIQIKQVDLTSSETVKQNLFDPFKNSPNTNFLTNLFSRIETYNASNSVPLQDSKSVNLNMEYLR